MHLWSNSCNECQIFVKNDNMHNSDANYAWNAEESCISKHKMHVINGSL